MNTQFHTEQISSIKLKVFSLIEEANVLALRESFKNVNVADFTQILLEVDSSKLVWALRALIHEEAAQVIPFLTNDKRDFVLQNLSSNEISQIFDEMAKDDAADIIEDLPNNLFRKVFASLKKQTREEINNLIEYDDHVVGSIMSVEFIDLEENLTAKEASIYLRDRYEDAEEVGIYYVINAYHQLVGTVNVQKIFFTKGAIKLKDIMDKHVISIGSVDLTEKAITYFKKYDLPTLPVISKAGELIGVITSDDLIDSIEEENTEDIQKQAGITPISQSYVETKPFRISMSRVSWLMILLISSTLSQIVLTAFQGTLANELDTRLTIALVALVPVISGTAGNAGSQAATSIVRSLALKELNRKSYWSVVGKEFQISSYVGIILISVNSLRMIIFYWASYGMVGVDELILTASTSLCLFIAIVLSKFVGSSLPFFAIFIKKDPAAMATPLLTTIIDALTTAIFFGISLGILSLII